MLKRIADLEAKSGIRIGLAQKILLAEIGTVEQILSILTGSAVTVKVVKQKEHAKTIMRHSLITSGDGRVLVRAQSKIFLRNLPTKTTRQLKSQESGIGTIITNNGLETFRKIVEIGYDPEIKSVFRKYQITYKKKIAFEITEELTEIAKDSKDIR